MKTLRINFRASAVKTALCLASFLLTLFFASRGNIWNVGIHPDEGAIVSFERDIHQNGYLTKRVYPTGWFGLLHLKEAVERPFLRWGKSIDRHLRQEGAFSVHRPSSFRQLYGAAHSDERSFSIQDGRNFNLFLFAFSAMLVFLAGTGAGLHPMAAFLSSLLLAFHPIPIEFSHYCETDIALVFSLSLFLWVSATAVSRKSPYWLGAASLAAGFALSCKYTLAPLVCLPPALAWEVFREWPGKTNRGRRRMIAWAWLGCLTLFLGGFLIGTPALYMATGDFFAKVRHVANATYGETTATLGAFAGSRWARIQLLAGSTLKQGAKVGPLFLAWTVLSACVVCFRPYRRQMAGTPFFLLLFILFSCFGMPWIRAQELLPFVVCAAVLAAYPIDWAFRAIGSAASRPARRAVAFSALAAALAVFVSDVVLGKRMSSAFVRRDMLAECQNWMQASAPQGAPCAFGKYVAGTSRKVFVTPVDLASLDESYPDSLALLPPRDGEAYFLRNRSFVGRDANRWPFSRKLLPRPQACVDAFERECARLKAWAIGSGCIRPVFSQSDIELWHFAASPHPTNDIPLRFERPVVIRVGVASCLYASGGGGPVGADDGLLLSRRWRSVSPPPLELSKESWAVVRSLGGPQATKVIFDKLVRPREGRLNPGGALAFNVDTSELWLREFGDIRPSAKICADNPLAAANCIATVTGDAAEAAFLLRKHGDAAAALALLERSGIDTDAKCVEAFLAAQAAGRMPEERWISAARSAVESFGRACAASKGGRADRDWSVAGIPLAAARDFARARHFPLDLPVAIFPGDYVVTIHFRHEVPEKAFSMALVNIQSIPAVPAPDNSISFDAHVEAATILAPRPEFLSAMPELWMQSISSVEISWDSLETLRGEASEIQELLARMDRRK